MTIPRLRVVDPDELPPAVVRARAERSVRRTLATLVIASVGLTMIGLVMVFSASSVLAYAQHGSSFWYFKRQMIYACLGLVVCLGAGRMRYRTWERLWVPLLAATIFLLFLVLHPSTNVVAGGSARWIPLGSFSFQPSELAKFVMVLTAAAILSRNFRFIADPVRMVMPLALIVGVVAGLIMLQPDLGTTMVIVVTVALLLFVVGIRMRVLALWALVVSVAGVALAFGAGYRRARLFSFLHPWADPTNTGYQIVQSLIALGSGHLMGVGLGASRQKWTFLPNAHTDFIFAIIGEELGLIGEILVLALFAALVYAGIRIAIRAPDTFGRLLAAGITTWIGFQALVNMGAVTGVLPIAGVPLPFISYGGSSLVVTLLGVGVLVSVARAGASAPARAGVKGNAPARAAARRPAR